MASKTSNYSLNLMDYNDPPNIKPISDNFNRIDTILYNKLDSAGGTISGDLILVKDPTIANHAATKKYVDSKIEEIPAGPAGPQGEPGQQGEIGPQGPQGEPGKSAYQAAKEGGYLGEEQEFNQKLAEDNPTQEELTQTLADYLKLTGGDITGNLNVNGELTQNGEPIKFDNPIVFGTYVGNSEVYKTGTQDITLGFKPKILFVFLDQSYFTSIQPMDYKMVVKNFTGDNYEQKNNMACISQASGSNAVKAYSTANGGSSSSPPGSTKVLELTENGFKVANAKGTWDDSSSYVYQSDECELNWEGNVYIYMAVK